MVGPSKYPQQLLPHLTNQQAILYTTPPIVIQLLVLIALSFIDPPHPTEELGVGDGVGVQSVTCSTQTASFYLFQICFDGMFIAFIFVPCFLSSKYIILFNDLTKCSNSCLFGMHSSLYDKRS